MQLDSITPVILTYNEEPNLARCLERLTWAKRIVIVDSHSTDATRQIAGVHANTDFITRVFDNHTSQWNYGVDAATTEWVLALDADYVPGAGFEDELQTLQAAPEMNAYFACFRYVIFGKPLRGSLYPPRAVLFRRSHCRYVQDGHTQLLEIKGSSGFLSTPIDHDDRKSLSRWISSQDKYAMQEATKLGSIPSTELRLQDRLRKTMILGPPLALIYALFVKGAIFDGWRGWYYVLQRTIAEIFLSLRLLERHLSSSRKDSSNS